MQSITNNSSENARLFSMIVGPERNFDIVNKKIDICGKNAEFFMIDGFVKDEIMEKILEAFLALKDEDMPETEQGFMDYIPYIEVSLAEDFHTITDNLLMGMVCMFLDGFSKCFIIDCRTYPARSVSEPWKNRVLRGSRDGFVETIVANIALIRRRIRTPDLCVEMLNAGTMSKTDIAVMYIQGKADSKLLENIKKRIQNVNVEALTMNLESLAEVLLPGPYINPFPKFKYTERPDSAAASIYDGNIVILVDNSPAVMVIPTSIFDIAEEADDYYFPPLTGTYLKLSRHLIAILSVVLMPLWIIALNNPDIVPKPLEFILIEEGGSTVPIIWQLFILEFCIDGLRLAAVNTPTLLSTPLSVIAGIVVGEYAVSSGWFDAECMLYMAFVTVGTYTQASYEIGYALKFFRIVLMVLSWLWSFVGFAIGLVALILTIGFNKTISGKSYVYPVIPFDGKMLLRKVFRIRLGKEKQ